MSKTELPLKGDETAAEEQVLKSLRTQFHFSRGAQLWIYTTSYPGTVYAESFGGTLPINAYRAAVALRGEKA